MSGFAGHYILHWVHIKLSAPDISGFPKHFILPCLVPIELIAL
jgi:hypothetical protein